MRSFAIEEPGSPVPALYATLVPNRFLKSAENETHLSSKQVSRIFFMTPNQLQVLFELRSGVKQLALTDQEYLGIFGATGKPKESGQDI